MKFIEQLFLNVVRRNFTSDNFKMNFEFALMSVQLLFIIKYCQDDSMLTEKLGEKGVKLDAVGFAKVNDKVEELDVSFIQAQSYRRLLLCHENDIV